MLLVCRKFADSKTLNERARETLYEDICQDPELGHSTDIQTAEFISNNMLARDRVSLNQLAISSTISLIEKVIKIGVELKEVYVDTVGDAGRYQASRTSNLFLQNSCCIVLLELVVFLSCSLVIVACCIVLYLYT